VVSVAVGLPVDSLQSMGMVVERYAHDGKLVTDSSTKFVKV